MMTILWTCLPRVENETAQCLVNGLSREYSWVPLATLPGSPQGEWSQGSVLALPSSCPSSLCPCPLCHRTPRLRILVLGKNQWTYTTGLAILTYPLIFSCDKLSGEYDFFCRVNATLAFLRDHAVALFPINGGLSFELCFECTDSSGSGHAPLA